MAYANSPNSQRSSLNSLGDGKSNKCQESDPRQESDPDLEATAPSGKKEEVPMEETSVSENPCKNKVSKDMREYGLHRGRNNHLDTCPFCKIESSHHSIMDGHLLGCPEVLRRQPTRECYFCTQVFPESQCFIHEVTTCVWNKATLKRKPSLQIQCPKCMEQMPTNVSAKFRLNLYRKHLLKCLPVLDECQTLAASQCVLTKANPSSEAKPEVNDIVSQDEQPKLLHNYRSSQMRWMIPCAYCFQKFPAMFIYQHALHCSKLMKQTNVKLQCCKICGQDNLDDMKAHETSCKRNSKPDKVKCYKCNRFTGFTVIGLTNHWGECFDDLIRKTNVSFERHWMGLSDCNPNQKKALVKAPSKEKPPAKRKLSHSGEIVEQKLHKPEVKQQQQEASLEKPMIKCFFCRSAIADDSATIKLHAFVCPTLREIETKRTCWICNLQFSQTHSYHHEWQCYLKHQPHSVKLRCPKCQAKVPRQEIENHCLNSCLRYLEGYIRGGSVQASSSRMESEINQNDDENGLRLVILDTFSMAETKPTEEASEPVQCPFCPKIVRSLSELKTQHTIKCNGIKAFEPSKQCQFCKEKMPISLHGLHSMTCDQNPCQLPATAHNFRECEILCPECKTLMRAIEMPVHLANCVQLLGPIMDNALNNDSCGWKQSHPKDYIKKAGLDKWLQP